MKKDKMIYLLFDALSDLYREAAELEEGDTPKLSRALNKAQKALGTKLESATE